MELQLLLVLIIAFIVLGPERMMDLAVKLGELTRKARQMWEEIRMQAYIEEVNRKVMEEETKEEDETEEEETKEEKEEYDIPDIEDYTVEDLEYTPEEEEKKDEFREPSTSNDASYGTSERAENKTD